MIAKQHTPKGCFDLKAVKELLRITPPILEGSLLGPLYVPFMLKAHGLVSDLVAEVEALRKEVGYCDKAADNVVDSIIDLKDQLAEANNLAANLKMDKEEMLKEIEQLKEELFEIAAQTPNPIHQGEAILPTATELEDRPYGRSAIGATHQIKIMQEYHKLKQQLTTLTEQHAKAVECLQSASLEPFICGVEQKGLKTILQDREDEINACLKELGVKE